MRHSGPQQGPHSTTQCSIPTWARQLAGRDRPGPAGCVWPQPGRRRGRLSEQSARRRVGHEPSSRRRRVRARWPLARRGGPGPGSQAHRDQARGDQVRGPARPRSPVGIATAQDSVGVAPTHVKHLVSGGTGHRQRRCGLASEQAAGAGVAFRRKTRPGGLG